jgi:hypothetical protein
MKFMATWSIPQDKFLPILKRWISMSPQDQANAGEGVKIIGRWHDVGGRSGVAIFESNDIAAVARYLGRWNPHMDISISPVLDDAEVTVVSRHIVADNNA